MVKLVYTQDLKSCGLKNRVGSIPAGGTMKNNNSLENSIVAYKFGAWPTFYYRVNATGDGNGSTLTMLRRQWGRFRETGTVQLATSDGLAERMVGRAGERGQFRRVRRVAS